MPGARWRLPPAVSGPGSARAGKPLLFSERCLFKCLLLTVPEHVNTSVQLALSDLGGEGAGPQACRLPPTAVRPLHRSRACIVGLLLTCGAVALRYSFTGPLPRCQVLSLLPRWALAAHCKAGSEMHIESAHPRQISRRDASPGPEKWESPLGAGGPPGLGAERAGSRGPRAASIKGDSCCLFSLVQ